MVSAEPILLVKKDGVLEASLLYAPSAISEWRNFAQKLDRDRISLTWEGRILRVAGHDMPHLKPEELYPAQKSQRAVEWHEDRARHLHFSEGGYFHGLQLWLDYTTVDPRLDLYGDSGEGRLRKTAERLRKGALRIALLGDSISQGANASAISGVPPFIAPYFELFLEKLGRATGAQIESRNFSVGGKTSMWGAEEAESVASWAPDLVLVAFGMNDASEGYTAEFFDGNLQKIRAAIRRKNPAVEFMWLSGMTPHPAWHLYRASLRKEHHEVLRNLADENSAFCDIMTGWAKIVSRKGFLSITGNGVNHPNDYGHRLYCDCLLHTMEKAASIGFGDLTAAGS